jgi:phosphoribosylaminoimidazolecarboxamide formyltransferase/IMP cyclohydrolase
MNPAGASSLANPLESYLHALRCDPVSAFGGIVAINGIIDVDLAEKLNEIFLEIVCAFWVADDSPIEERSHVSPR